MSTHSGIRGWQSPEDVPRPRWHPCSDPPALQTLHDVQSHAIFAKQAASMSDNEDLDFPQPAMRGPVRGARPAVPVHEPEDDGCASEARMQARTPRLAHLRAMACMAEQTTRRSSDPQLGCESQRAIKRPPLLEL